MRVAFLLFPLFPMLLAAQTQGLLNLYPANPATEQTDFQRAVADGSGSAADMTRELEQFLTKYPNSAQRAGIEPALYKNAVDTNDSRRIALYGEKLLIGKPDDEMNILNQVIRALVVTGGNEAWKKALTYGKRYELTADAFRARPPEGHTTQAQWIDLADRELARATVVEARAAGSLGNFADALAFATRSWKANPTAEAAREMAQWLLKLGRHDEAAASFAEAAVMEDPRATWTERNLDRKTATELYAKVHGSAQGLGDVFLAAFDRSAKALADRTARYKAIDSNYGLTDPFAFRIPAVGKSTPPTLDMAALKGKTVVVDFWATWCGPCVAEQPLIDNVKRKYAGNPDVVFLSLNSDDDHSLVEPFMKAQKWTQDVYLESGLASLFTVSSLPSVMVVDRTGAVRTRIMGFTTDTFERLLSARIDESLHAAKN